MTQTSRQSLETQKEWLRTRCRLERAELCAHLQETKANGPILAALLRQAGPGAGLLSAFPVLTWLFKTYVLRGRGGISWWSKGLASCLLLRFKSPSFFACKLVKTCWKKHPRVLVGLAVLVTITGFVVWQQRDGRSKN